MKEKELLADHFADSAVAELHEADTAGTLTNLTTVEGVIGDGFDGRDVGVCDVVVVVDEMDEDGVGIAACLDLQLGHHLTFLLRFAVELRHDFRRCGKLEVLGLGRAGNRHTIRSHTPLDAFAIHRVGLDGDCCRA